MVLFTLVSISCQEQDDTYGESVKDYHVTGTAKDADAANYFRQKEVACVTDKADIAKEYPNNWISVQLIVRDADGGIEILPTTQVSAHIRGSYEALNGGKLLVSTVSKLGYRKDFTLFPCNVQDSYFYLADMSADGKAISGVLAYSLASASQPLAYELGYEYHDPRDHSLAKYQVVGLAVPSGQIGKSLKATLGNTGYFAYLLRQQQRCITHDGGSGPHYSLSPWRVVLDCGGVKMNGTAVHTMTVSDDFEAGGSTEAPGVHLFNDASSTPMARFGDAPQAANLYNTRVRVSLVRRGSTLHAYYTWAWLTIPPYRTELVFTVD